MNNLQDNQKIDTESMGYDTFLTTFKNRRLKDWFYYFQHGHPFLLKEESDIIIETRLNDKASKWMNDSQIQELVKLRVKAMYKNKYPDAKRWSLSCFF